MSEDMVLSIIAEDRPGLVQTLSELVAGYSGNWIDSSMARLGGEFAGIVRVSIPSDNIAAFEEALGGLKSDGIEVSVRRNSAAAIPLTGQRVELTLTGNDHPGIVHEISSALAERGASIEELKTEVFSGSMSGDKLFSAQARIVLPADQPAEAVREHLETLAQDIMVDIDLSEAL